MAREQGAIVTGRDPFGDSGRRPYLLLSNGTHPFHGEEYVAAVVTTTERERAIPLDGTYVDGRLPYRSFVNPWNVLTVKEAGVERHVATVADEVVEETVAALGEYLRLESEL